MKKANLITTAALLTATMFSAGIYAADQPEAAGDTPAPAAAPAATMPMMGGPQGGMPMMPPQGGGMPMMHQPGAGMPMMGGGCMKNPQMMQQMMAMKQEHMKVMETHLANIEALLRQLVELQKK